jgi:hypothetical protein
MLVVSMATAVGSITLESSGMQTSSPIEGVADDVHNVDVLRRLAGVLLDEGLPAKRLAAAARTFGLAGHVMAPHRSSALLRDLTDQFCWNFTAMHFRTMGMAFSEAVGDDAADGMEDAWSPLLSEDSGAFE